jgi:DDE family transposase
VRLWLSIIAYNLDNLWRRMVLPQRIEKWSLTSLQQRLVKTGGRLVKHARYYWLLLGEGHLTRRLFVAMLRRIGTLSLPARIKLLVVTRDRCITRFLPNRINQLVGLCNHFYKNPVPKLLRHVAVSDESGFGSGGNGSRRLREGRFEADDTLGEKSLFDSTPMGVYFRLPERQKINSG